jgi:hypothetical protein
MRAWVASWRAFKLRIACLIRLRRVRFERQAQQVDLWRVK